MKRLLVLLLAGCALLTSCKEEDSRLGTRPGHDDAFVLAGDRLVPAHRYVVDFPAAGGTVDLKIVSGGIPGDGPTASSSCWINSARRRSTTTPNGNGRTEPSNSFRDISRRCVSPRSRTGSLRLKVRSCLSGRRLKTACPAVPKPKSYSVRPGPNNRRGGFPRAISSVVGGET